MKIQTLVLLSITILLTAGCASKKKHKIVERENVYPFVNATLGCDNAVKLYNQGDIVQAWQVANATIGQYDQDMRNASIEDGRGITVISDLTQMSDCYKVVRNYLNPANFATEPAYNPEYFTEKTAEKK